MHRIAIIALLLTGFVQSQEAGQVQPPAQEDAGHTGAVSEEEFKKLHELKKDKAPPPQGIEIEIDGNRAYLSLPKNAKDAKDAKTGFPAVIVIHEWWGLNDHIRHWADRLAADGYAALAVDLYSGKVATTAEEAMTLIRSVDEAKAAKILGRAHEFLRKDARVRAPRVGSIGWCFGGGWSLRTALKEAKLDAAVLYYGRLVTDPEELKSIRAPLLGVFGNQDRSIPPKSVDEFDAALETAGVTHTILRYDANHAFANPSSARYDQKSAAAAWSKVRQFLATHLRPKSAEPPAPKKGT